jgi:hypothetical protein
VKIDLKLGVLKPTQYKKNRGYLPSRFLTNRLMEQWEEMDEGPNAHAKTPAVPSSDDQARANETSSLLEDGWTRSMYPMGQLQVNQASPDEIDWVEYTHDGERERATLGGFECTWYPVASFEQEITLSSAQSRAVSHSVPMTVFVRQCSENTWILMAKSNRTNRLWIL